MVVLQESTVKASLKPKLLLPAKLAGVVAPLVVEPAGAPAPEDDDHVGGVVRGETPRVRVLLLLFVLPMPPPTRGEELETLERILSSSIGMSCVCVVVE